MSLGSHALQNPHPADQKSDPVLSKVESALEQEKPGTLIIADREGKIIEKLDVEDLRQKGFNSLVDFADKRAKPDAAKPDECHRISTKCVRCPDGKIYCTNDSKFAVAKKARM